MNNEPKEPYTIQKAARDAILVQNACNTSGIIASMQVALGAVNDDLREKGRHNSIAVKNHPVIILFTSKLADLVLGQMTDIDVYSRAYDACKALARGD